jgi:RNA polymerase sigma-70 factor (sigma-E family)
VAGQDEDFAAFMAARWPALHRFAYLLCGDREEAQDLAQAALVKTYVSWPRIRASEAVDSYVRTSLTRLFLSERRRRRLLTVPIGPEHDQGLTTEPDTAQRHVLWRQVQELPTRQRAVLVLRYYEDLTEADVAVVMGCSRGTVKSQCSKALAKLRAGLPADLPR